VESTQDFFRRGNKNRSEPSGMETDHDFFATPGKSAMSACALALFALILTVMLVFMIGGVV